MAYQSFEELEVWKRSCRLGGDLYKTLDAWNDYSFRDQVRRSAISCLGPSLLPPTSIFFGQRFFTCEVWTRFGLVTHYVLLFIHIWTRRAVLGDVTNHPDDEWMAQVA